MKLDSPILSRFFLKFRINGIVHSVMIAEAKEKHDTRVLFFRGKRVMGK
jgi:hypothetical protein